MESSFLLKRFLRFILHNANYTKLNDHSGDVKTPVQPSYVKSKICLSAFRNPVLQDGAGATAFHQVKIVRITRDENSGRIRHKTNPPTPEIFCWLFSFKWARLRVASLLQVWKNKIQILVRLGRRLYCFFGFCLRRFFGWASPIGAFELAFLIQYNLKLFL